MTGVAIAALPSLITIAGLLCSVLGWAHQLPGLLLVGLALDVLDGATAREYGVTSRFGARLDWTTDVVVAACLCAELGSAAVVALAMWCGLADTLRIRVSGRALATCAVLWVWS